MKLQNTLTKEELEMVLQLSITIYSKSWKEGQRFLAAINTLKPSLMKEIRANKELFSSIFRMETVSAEIYATICPDPPRMPEEFECPCCGRVLEPLEEEFDMKYTDEEVQELDNMTQKVVEEVCFRCGKYNQIKTTETPFCDSCFKEVNQEYNG